MKRVLPKRACICMLLCIATSAFADDIRTYALVAAVGSHLTTIQEQQSTGSHLPPYVRKTVDLPDNVLNKLALHSLDRAVESVDRASACTSP